MDPSTSNHPQYGWLHDPYLWSFIFLFFFRYTRLIVNSIAYYLSRPFPIPSKPTFPLSDVTVVISTTNINTSVFTECVRSILNHSISALIITTAGNAVPSQISAFLDNHQDPRIKLLHQSDPNRREQTAAAMPHIKTALLILSDDHTFWPAHNTFLQSLIAPFENQRIGAVGTVLQARHHGYPISFKGFWNFMGMTYLARRIYEFLATNAIDGGLSCLSSRFAVFRTEIYADPAFLRAYLNEYILFGLVGPLNADDDKFHTRWLTMHGWDIKIQSGPESVMETTLGEYPKFLEQCVRWTRTTWRSNPRALFTEGVVWTRFPWTTYSILLYSFVRFSLFYEAVMFWLLHLCFQSHFQTSSISYFETLATGVLAAWIMGMKFVKLIPHFLSYPVDLVYFPVYLLFGYFSSFVKIWAMLTCWDVYWGTAKKVPSSEKLEGKPEDIALLESVEDSGMQVEEEELVVLESVIVEEVGGEGMSMEIVAEMKAAR
ncbi:glycosyltransferase family 2 protein [Zopfia rhizophila CBS 207.26]|uniref:Glycosyltransferase family 2 protein n=1 Tax=Zopfia rhizophila CBS 207.26 TaxID=1314779 RepID=A0A6A6E205_9PEZI|nr:glycosyltransferase family 2 protein [Zopfia rhizophila CBS 207.26]